MTRIQYILTLTLSIGSCAYGASSSLATTAALTSPLESAMLTSIPEELAPPQKEKPAYSWNYWSAGVELGANKQFNFGRRRTTNRNDGTAMSRERTPVFGIDYRFSIEKSWQIARRWTFALDLAVFTPAFAFGYLLNERMRLNFGFHVPVLMLSNNHTFKNFSLPAPRIGFDYFIGKRTLLRTSASLDATSNGRFYWPQIMIGIKQLF